VSVCVYVRGGWVLVCMCVIVFIYACVGVGVGVFVCVRGRVVLYFGIAHLGCFITSHTAASSGGYSFKAQHNCHSWGSSPTAFNINSQCLHPHSEAHACLSHAYGKWSNMQTFVRVVLINTLVLLVTELF
jgi:hypothetical protein